MTLRITGVGMASCVGLDAVNTAAAVRAGISRFGPLSGATVYDEDELETPLTGAAIDLLTSGYVQTARWLRLSEYALNDLIINSQLQKTMDWSDVPIIWVLPDCAGVFEWPDTDIDNIVQEFLTGTLSKILDIELSSPAKGYFFEGQSGTARALRGIRRSFEKGHLNAAIIMSVDSLAEPLILQNLIGAERIKTPSNSTGLTPGEGASALLVQVNEAQSLPTGTYAEILSETHMESHYDRESVNWRNDNILDMANNMASAILNTVATLEEESVFCDLYIDLNGEEWRSNVWGIAQVKLIASSKINIDKCKEIVPGTSWGDIGAASHSASLILAGRSFMGNYSLSTVALVISISDSGSIGTTLIRKSGGNS